MYSVTDLISEAETLKLLVTPIIFAYEKNKESNEMSLCSGSKQIPRRTFTLPYCKISDNVN